MKSGNVTMRELELPDIGRYPENFWRLNDLRSGVKSVYCRRAFENASPDLSDCLAARLPGRPWFLQLWEPIHTKAPSPARAQPHCCYLRTVIFYHRPYIVRAARPWKCNGRWTWLKGGGAFAEYDQVETRLGWDDLIAFDGDTFEVSGGRVMWHHARWWMHRTARRKTVNIIGFDRGRA